MNKIIIALSILLVFIGSFGCKKAPEKRYSKLPEFSLLDPAGIKRTSDELLKNGMVLVVTAPTLRNSSAQKGWDEVLLKYKKSNKASLVFLEDMSASIFKDEALSEMKKEYDPNKPPILLLGEGKLRNKLGVEKNDTVVLVYNKDGELIYSVKEDPSIKSAQIIWEKAK